MKLTTAMAELFPDSVSDNTSENFHCEKKLASKRMSMAYFCHYAVWSACLL